MNNHQTRAGAFAPPEPVSHEAFRKTEAYAALCEEFGIDPAASWDKETLASIEAAAEFLWEYEQLRRAGAAWTPETVAAYLESVVLLHETDAGSMIWRDRYGAIVVVTDPMGDHWMLTAEPYSPERAALAMTLDRTARTPMQ